MAKTFEGKAVLVTGGSRGLGAAIARAFAENGADVAISYATSDEKAQTVVADVRKYGVQGEAFRADQADPAQISRLVGDVAGRFGKLDILVNNAAVAWLGPRVGADNYDADKMNQQWSINTLGSVATIRAAAKVLSNGGRVISISSGLASRANQPGVSDYAATKAAINTFSKGVAHDLADRNITVNVIQAGLIDTGIAVAPDMEANMRARLASRPIKRPARVDEVAAGVLFLASPAASYMTGAIIDIDGGFAA
jgi:NAD(P)-dependent dehydrogenase (short-subunit alcohol dehydrogenase family)